MADDELPPDPFQSAFSTLVALVEHWRLLVVGPLVVGTLAVGASYLVSPTFTARTSFIAPQPQGGAAAALAALGPLAGLAGAATGARSSSEQYVALIRSRTIQDQLIDKYDLMSVYENDYREDTRRDLRDNVRVTLSKREGMIEVEVDDHDPKRAAAMANEHVEFLRRLTASLAITEAQQRRAFFEAQLADTRDRLALAQRDLQESGFTESALRAEPKAAAEGYARLRAELTGARVKLQSLRGSLADEAPEVRQQLAAIAAIQKELSKIEQAVENDPGPGYINKYREFKYQETLFEMFARQFELARVDEAREGALIQTVDAALVPEKKSKPKRSIVGIVAAVSTAMLLVAALLARMGMQRLAANPKDAEQIARLKRALTLR